MNNLTVPTDPSKQYVVAAHTFGLTGGAIIEDLNTHGHDRLTEADIRDILKDIRQFPKSTYGWYNWMIKATNGQNPVGIYPWNPWSSRFILNCKAKNETNSTIFAKMQKCGYEIPGLHWVEVVLKAHLFIENELANGFDTLDDAASQNIIIMAHNWGYTLPEITSRIHRSTLRPNRFISKINPDMVKMALEKSGIPEEQHRRGRDFAAVAQKFVLSAYNLGMDVNNIRDQMYVHGFDHFDPKLIADFLNTKGLWQGQKSKQTKAIQAAQPTQPKARNYVLPGDVEIAAQTQSVRVNREPGRRIDVMDLLN